MEQEQERTTVETFKKKGYLKVEDNDCLPTIDEICAVFGTDATHRGFLRIGTTPVPLNSGIEIWYPNADNDKGWENKLPDGNGIFTEYHEDAEKRKEHVEACLKDNKVRVTFFKSKDKYHDTQYHFIGVFVLDIPATKEQGKCIWHKISNEYFL